MTGTVTNYIRRLCDQTPMEKGPPTLKGGIVLECKEIGRVPERKVFTTSVGFTAIHNYFRG